MKSEKKTVDPGTNKKRIPSRYSAVLFKIYLNTSAFGFAVCLNNDLNIIVSFDVAAAVVYALFALKAEENSLLLFAGQAHVIINSQLTFLERGSIMNFSASEPLFFAVLSTRVPLSVSQVAEHESFVLCRTSIVAL